MTHRQPDKVSFNESIQHLTVLEKLALVEQLVSLTKKELTELREFIQNEDEAPNSDELIKTPSAPISATPINEEQELTSPIIEIDSGLVELSIALAAIAATIAVFLPDSKIPPNYQSFISYLTTILAVVSAFCASWLMIHYVLQEVSQHTNNKEIINLFQRIPKIWQLTPYGLLAICTLLLLTLAFAMVTFF